MSAVTQWFGVKREPEYPGWYDYKGHGMRMARMFWNGAWYTRKNRKFQKIYPLSCDCWRGLAEKPE